MMTTRCLICLIVTLLSLCANAQKSPSTTPGKMEVEAHQIPLDPPNGPLPAKLDPVKLRQEADELSHLAESVSADVSQVLQGKMPKEMTDKLKQIEKLSKRLRAEVTP
jgi:hypothetical protein